MSIFASRTIRVIELPPDIEPDLNPATGQPHAATIQKLAGRHLERARHENMFESVDMSKRIGVSFQQELAELAKKNKKTEAELAEEGKKDPLNMFNHYVLLRFGILNWTYPESLEPVSTITDAGVTVDRISALDDLDEDALKWFAEQILRLSKPSLFRDQDQEEAERKNAVAASTAA